MKNADIDNYVGICNGWFFHFLIPLKGNYLKQNNNNVLCGM